MTPGPMLLVDDDEVFRERLAQALRQRGRRSSPRPTATRRCARPARGKLAAAVVDLRMPGMTGTELVPQLLRLQPKLRVVVLTGYGSIASAVEAMRLGAHNYVSKPADADDVLAAVTGDARPIETPGRRGGAAPDAGARRVGAHPAHPGGHRQQRLGDRAPARHHAAHAAAQAEEVPAAGLTRSRGAARRRDHIGKPHKIQVRIAVRSSSVIGTPASGGGIVQESTWARTRSCQSATCWYCISGQGPPTMPLWQSTQRLWKIGATSAQWGGGSGQTVGACTVQTSGAAVVVAGRGRRERAGAPSRTARQTPASSDAGRCGPDGAHGTKLRHGRPRVEGKGGVRKNYAAKKRRIVGARAPG